MRLADQLRALWHDLLAAVQFLTRLPVPAGPYFEGSLARAVKFFPVVGLLVGSGGAALDVLLTPHLPAMVVALLVVTYFVAVTGCFHEDGLADALDGFGGGWERDRVLEIMRDSRIGSYGAAALVLSLLARVLLLAALPPVHATMYLMAAPVLGRWTTLPLSYFLPPARAQRSEQMDGQGARIARLTTRGSFMIGTLLTAVIVPALLRMRGIAPVLISVAVTWLTGMYYSRRIGGVTGDCFGATNQLTEIAVYLCGVWV